MSLSLFAPVSTHRWGRLRPVALVLFLAVGAHLGAARVPAVAQKAAPKGNPRVTMVVEKRGDIVIELLPAAAPKTVAHFLDLVKKKFYDGILFHRYVEGFVVQGGDPKSKEVDGSLIKDIPATQVGEQYGLGGGGSGKNVPLEAKLKHARGTVRPCSRRDREDQQTETRARNGRTGAIQCPRQRRQPVLLQPDGQHRPRRETAGLLRLRQGRQGNGCHGQTAAGRPYQVHPSGIGKKYQEKVG